MLMKIFYTFFSLLQSQSMIFFALIPSAPETGSSGTDPAPFRFQLLALPAEFLHLQVLLPQSQDVINDFKFLRTFTRIIVDNFILFIFYESFSRVQLGNKQYFFIF